MDRVATWMQENAPVNLPGAPEITQEHTLISATR